MIEWPCTFIEDGTACVMGMYCMMAKGTTTKNRRIFYSISNCVALWVIHYCFCFSERLKVCHSIFLFACFCCLNTVHACPYVLMYCALHRGLQPFVGQCIRGYLNWWMSYFFSSQWEKPKNRVRVITTSTISQMVWSTKEWKIIPHCLKRTKNIFLWSCSWDCPCQERKGGEHFEVEPVGQLWDLRWTRNESLNY